MPALVLAVSVSTPPPSPCVAVPRVRPVLRWLLMAPGSGPVNMPSVCLTTCCVMEILVNAVTPRSVSRLDSLTESAIPSPPPQQQQQQQRQQPLQLLLSPLPPQPSPQPLHR